MPRVDSRAILRIHYDAEKQSLDVVFTTGHAYRYFDVPEAIYRQFTAADSKGRFFNTHIIDRFRFEELARRW